MPKTTYHPIRRHGGGQPGNTNALKHGFYTRRFHKRDISGVETTSLKNLTEEIALIRIFIRRMVESAVQEPDYYNDIDILRAICLASGTITRVIKAQTFINSEPTDFYDDVDRAIAKITEMWHLDEDYSLPPTPPVYDSHDTNLSPET